LRLIVLKRLLLAIIEKLNYLITLNFSFGTFCLMILLGVGRFKLLIKKIIIINTMTKIKILINGFISVPPKPLLVFR